MAKVKPGAEPEESILDAVKRMANDFDAQNPLIGTKYIVVEGFHKGNEYDYNIDWFETAKFEFDTKEERQEWLDRHEPEKYRVFRLASQDIRIFHPKPYTSRMPMFFERTD